MSVRPLDCDMLIDEAPLEQNSDWDNYVPDFFKVLPKTLKMSPFEEELVDFLDFFKTLQVSVSLKNLSLNQIHLFAEKESLHKLSKLLFHVDMGASGRLGIEAFLKGNLTYNQMLVLAKSKKIQSFAPELFKSLLLGCGTRSKDLVVKVEAERFRSVLKENFPQGFYDFFCFFLALAELTLCRESLYSGMQQDFYTLVLGQKVARGEKFHWSKKEDLNALIQDLFLLAGDLQQALIKFKNLGKLYFLVYLQAKWMQENLGAVQRIHFLEVLTAGASEKMRSEFLLKLRRYFPALCELSSLTALLDKLQGKGKGIPDIIQI